MDRMHSPEIWQPPAAEELVGTNGITLSKGLDIKWMDIKTYFDRIATMWRTLNSTDYPKIKMHIFGFDFFLLKKR